MDYQKIYNKIINNAKLNNHNKNKYYESHHIIPKCLNGDDNENNLVKLTLKEHYICHKLLCEIYPNNKSLAHAYWMMTIMTVGALENIRKDNLYRKDGEKIRRIRPFLEGEYFNISSREYAWCREHWRNLSLGIKRTNEQCERISKATKLAMKNSDKIKKCRANKGTHFYYEISTGKVHKWFPGDPELDLTKYKWGRGHISQQQKEKLSKTQLLDKTICKIGNTNYRYCWYKDYIKNIPNCFKDLHQKQCNSLRQISKLIINALSYLKDKDIFIDEDILFRPNGGKNGLTIIYPSIYEICLNILENENPVEIGDKIYQNIELIRKLNKQYIKN